MNKFCYFFIFLLINLGAKAIFAETKVKIEVKQFDKQTFFIAYHERDQNVDINLSGNLIDFRFDREIALNIINPNLFYSLATNAAISLDKKIVSFATKEEFQKKGIIHGEKLTAIRLISSKDKETSKEEQSLDQNQIQQQMAEKVNIKDKSSVKLSQSKDKLSLSFEWEDKNVGFAAFKRGKYLWLVFDKYKKFIAPKNKLIKSFEQVESRDSTIIRTEISEDIKVIRVSKSSNNWQLILTKKLSRADKVNVLKAETDKEKNDSRFIGNYQKNSIVSFNDPEIGDLLIAIPLKKANSLVNYTREFIDYTILPSLQGIAIAIMNDEVQVKKNSSYLEVLAPKQLLQLQKAPEPKTEIAPKVVADSKPSSLLPIIDSRIDIIDFNFTKSRLISEASASESKQQTYDKHIELAKFLFMHGFYHESLSALELNDDLLPEKANNDFTVQLLEAVNLTLIGSSQDARPIYEYLKQSLHPEMTLWNNYNEYLLGNNPPVIGFLANLRSILNLYPDNLYWPIALAEIELALQSNDLKSAEIIFKNLRTPHGKYAGSLKYYKAIYFKKKDQLNLAKQFFEDLKSNNNDPYNKVRAELELVKLQFAKKEINIDEAIKRLEDLRFDWRGDKLEYDLLIELAGYYKGKNDNVSAIRMYKYIQNSLSNKISSFYVTSEMTKIYNKIFLPGGLSEVMDDFDAVALFYEFRDFTPIGMQGDEVVLSVANKLINLDLLESAAELLRHQVEYRLTGQKRIINADHLALVLLIDKKPEEAIKILEETAKDNYSFDEHLYRVRLKAKAMIDLQRYEDAITALKDDDSSEAIMLKKEALFKSEKWPEYIDLVANEVNKALIDKISGSIAQDVLRLAIAYNRQGEKASLRNLAEALDTDNEMLKTTIDLLLVSDTAIDYQNLEKSLKIDQMQNLLENYKKQLFNS